MTVTASELPNCINDTSIDKLTLRIRSLVVKVRNRKKKIIQISLGDNVYFDTKFIITVQVI